MSQINKERSPRATMAKHALDLLSGPLRTHLGHVSRAGMQTLLGAVQRAESLDEIEIVMHYQQARSQEQKRGEDGTWSAELVKHLLQIMRAASASGDDRKQAQAAAEQLSLVARIHRVIAVQDKPPRREQEDER